MSELVWPLDKILELRKHPSWRVRQWVLTSLLRWYPGESAALANELLSDEATQVRNVAVACLLERTESADPDRVLAAFRIAPANTRVTAAELLNMVDYRPAGPEITS